MFWRKNEDSIQQTFVLTESMRTADPWLQAVLHADRYGSESWEMYCFCHGLPTRNPGSWLPDKGKPSCGKERCQHLASREWPEMWARSGGRLNKWHLRAAMECGICSAERQRRCCIIDSKDPAASGYTEEPFASAPFVHPFRHPSYHAQQLRTMAFAKSRNRRLLWITAHDVLAPGASTAGAEKHELRKERWLEFHDRFTSGIPGVLPLVLDLPIRFQDSPNQTAKKMGVFKNSRGWLRGWELPPEESARLEQLPDSEVVLRLRPLRLHIEVHTATEQMPLVDGKRIYSLAVQVRPWSLDRAGKVKVLRYGFPIVPDWSGTAHAYCGSTLEACLGDLLPWHQKPRKEDALRAYIIKSRVRDASRILLAQPYSPHLFRQGVLPGPHLLMQVLQNEITPEEAKKAWKKAEKASKAEESTGQSWIETMELPCRRCTDVNQGVEVTKPLSAFSTSLKLEDLWNTAIRKGQDLTCFKCAHALQWQTVGAVISCDSCGKIQPSKNFTPEMRRLWETLSTEKLECKKCEGESASIIKNSEFFLCNGHCKRELPEYHFIAQMLVHWQTKETKEQMLSAKCARCVVKDMKVPASTTFLCQRCKHTKHLPEFSAVELKQWLSKDVHKLRWICYDCQYPACCICKARPSHAVKGNALSEGQYYCSEHRYPSCTHCGKQRNSHRDRKELRLQAWTCSDCKKNPCRNCSTPCVPAAKHRPSDMVYCSDSCRYPPCLTCGAARPQRSEDAFHEQEVWVCVKCRKGQCHKCSAPCAPAAGSRPSDVVYCSENCRYPPCPTCGTARPRRNRTGVFHNQREWWCKMHHPKDH
jgi:hypothetical protein